ncbi:hypothetical protein K504DRAFT_508658 [Pleomassaria siparia CBS 279.74]|uniref:Uncharacterized protein n=1 Tax=Pleomassaria siparia CBS 279.74 TaxID=1314801 RepID=A0A6G1JRK2_9PLEO|nr:hypothetical protein K504DRAFT_508658 [Pleomassaria siparia CBS 279.74]
MPQRKSIPIVSPQPQVLSAPVAQKTFTEIHPTPPPQVTTGYLSSHSTSLQSQQQQYTQSRMLVKQQYTQSPVPVEQQYTKSPAPFHQQQTQQYSQQSRYNHSAAVVQQQEQSQSQTQPRHPSFHSQQHPQYAQSPTPIHQHQQYQQAQIAQSSASIQQYQQSLQQYSQKQPRQNNYTTAAREPQQSSTPTTPNSHVSPITPNQLFFQPPQTAFNDPAIPNTYSTQQHHGFSASSRVQQSIHTPQTPSRQFLPPPHQSQQSHRSSTTGGTMMGKMSSKFSSFPKSTSISMSNMCSKSGTPSAPNPNGKSFISTSDWKKWGTRAAIGVAAIGALSLGVDAIFTPLPLINRQLDAETAEILSRMSSRCTDDLDYSLFDELLLLPIWIQVLVHEISIDRLKVTYCIARGNLGFRTKAKAGINMRL